MNIKNILLILLINNLGFFALQSSISKCYSAENCKLRYEQGGDSPCKYKLHKKFTLLNGQEVDEICLCSTKDVELLNHEPDKCDRNLENFSHDFVIATEACHNRDECLKK